MHEFRELDRTKTWNLPSGEALTPLGPDTIPTKVRVKHGEVVDETPHPHPLTPPPPTLASLFQSAASHLFRETSLPVGKQDFVALARGGLVPLPVDTTVGKNASEHRFRDDGKPLDKEDFRLSTRGSLDTLPPDVSPLSRAVTLHDFRGEDPSCAGKWKLATGKHEERPPLDTTVHRSAASHLFRETSLPVGKQDFNRLARGELKSLGLDTSPSKVRGGEGGRVEGGGGLTRSAFEVVRGLISPRTSPPAPHTQSVAQHKFRDDGKPINKADWSLQRSGLQPLGLDLAPAAQTATRHQFRETSKIEGKDWQKTGREGLRGLEMDLTPLGRVRTGCETHRLVRA